MYSYASQPSGIVIMQSPIDPNLFAIAHPFQGAFLNASHNQFNLYAPPNGATILTTAPPPHTMQHTSSAAATLVDYSTANNANLTLSLAFSSNNNNNNSNSNYNCTNIDRNTILTNRSSRSNAYFNASPAIRRTRSGHISKTRVSKRTEANLTKTCPSCSKLWRLCNCSNVKNRPAPKPYCKFIPPRMLNKKRDNN